jgi:hypothetical protein
VRRSRWTASRIALELRSGRDFIDVACIDSLDVRAGRDRPVSLAVTSEQFSGRADTGEPMVALVGVALDVIPQDATVEVRCRSTGSRRITRRPGATSSGPDCGTPHTARW